MQPCTCKPVYTSASCCVVSVLISERIIHVHAIFQNQVAFLFIIYFFFYVVFVCGFGGTWVCGESWLAIKDFNPPPQFSRLGT